VFSNRNHINNFDFSSPRYIVHGFLLSSTLYELSLNRGGSLAHSHTHTHTLLSIIKKHFENCYNACPIPQGDYLNDNFPIFGWTFVSSRYSECKRKKKLSFMSNKSSYVCVGIVQKWAIFLISKNRIYYVMKIMRRKMKKCLILRQV
jgi:hypothetical protein